MTSLVNIRRPFSLALRGICSLRRFSTSIPYVTEEQKPNSTRSSFIHPSAIIHPGAILGQGVSVGPFCSIGPSAKLGNSCQLYPGSHVLGNTELGDNCTVMMGAVVGDDLPGCTVIGFNNVIGHHAVVGIRCQDMKFKLGNECFLEIGDNNEIREFASIHRSSRPSERTVIGDNNLIMGSCHIAHDCKVGNNNIFANNTLLAGHVIVEDYAHTAGAIAVHQFCHIGSFSFIGGGSVVSQDVPKYTMVSGERAELRGLNLEGLRRSGFSITEVGFKLDHRILFHPKPVINSIFICLNFPISRVRIPISVEGFQIKSLRGAYRKIFMPGDGNSENIEDRLADLEQDEELGRVPAVHSMVQSIRDSFSENRRGICKFRSWTGS